ncbi:MAG: PD-(D/E)XK nuclease family protein [Treponema sp.]|jgi:hypothetical protein|nr:PD-(D/E)XK nuclease family protein [Treponema sp.]
MEITNRLNLPEAIVKAVSTELHNKSDKELSATTLLKGIKEIILERRYWEKLKDDAADRIWAVWGEAVHALLETEGEHEFSEIDVHGFIDEIKITGRIDNYNMEAGIITDYKTASVWKTIVGDFEDWRMQGAIYSWLLYNNGFRIEKCRFIALLKDHSKSKAKFDSNYPQSPVVIYEFQITKALLEEAGKFVKQRVAEYLKHIGKADDDIPPCTDKERWAEKTKYAVMKQGNKRAIKVCDTEIEARQKAESQGIGHYVETRPGTSKKCSDYCVCRDYCNFYNNIVKQQGTSEE